jgi:hypothetical protein
LAVFTINSDEKISDVFIASDAKIDASFIEIVGAKLGLKFKTIDKAAGDEDKGEGEEKSRLACLNR